MAITAGNCWKQIQQQYDSRGVAKSKKCGVELTHGARAHNGSPGAQRRLGANLEKTHWIYINLRNNIWQK